MTKIDNLSNFLSGLKNANIRGHLIYLYPYSIFIDSIVKKLYSERYLRGYKFIIKNNKKYIVILIKYNFQIPLIFDIKRFSKRSKRIYKSAKYFQTLTKLLDGLVIISTPYGLKTLDEAVDENLGGELLFIIKH